MGVLYPSRAISRKPEAHFTGHPALVTKWEEDPMAEHATEYATANGNDYAEHERTYRAFIQLTKWGTASVVVLLILMAAFLL
jgi:hypothetical protein